LDLELNIITTIAYKCCADHSVFMNYDPCGESFARPEQSEQPEQYLATLLKAEVRTRQIS